MTSTGSRLRVLHLVDRVTGGVPVAVRTYVAHSPSNTEHVIASPFLGGEPAPVWDGLDVLHIDWDASSPLRALGGLRRLIHREHFDVVHAHSSFPGVYARLLISPRRGHLVYTPHCFAFLRTDVSAPVRSAYRLVEAILMARTGVLAACGPGERAEALKLGVLEERIVVVPNVPSVAAGASARRRTEPGESGTLHVGMLGRWAPQKDPVYFAARVAELAASLHPVAVEGWWIGDAERDPASAELGRPVSRTGWLTPSEVGERLRGLDVYLHSAAWEGFPIALLDAHASGVPILCRQIAAVPGLPRPMSIEGGSSALVAAVRAGQFVEWSQDNWSRWEAYLGDRSAGAQRDALAEAWSPAVNARSL